MVCVSTKDRTLSPEMQAQLVKLGDSVISKVGSVGSALMCVCLHIYVFLGGVCVCILSQFFGLYHHKIKELSFFTLVKQSASLMSFSSLPSGYFFVVFF